MKIRVQVLIESETGNTDAAENIVCLEREDLRLENLGLALAEAKSILAGVQQSMVDRQIEEYIDQEACCSLWEGTAPQRAPSPYVSYAVW